jgi:hypothetical protein
MRSLCIEVLGALTRSNDEALLAHLRPRFMATLRAHARPLNEGEVVKIDDKGTRTRGQPEPQAPFSGVLIVVCACGC